MKIQLEYDVVDAVPYHDENTGLDKVRELGRTTTKTYECDVLDVDMVESPIGKNLNLFIIDNMQISRKEDVDLVIDMLKNVRKQIDRTNKAV